MSANEIPTREVARRVFADEFNDATFSFKESDDDRAPVYALLPTGEKVNRVFFVGTLTEKDDVGEDNEYWRGRIVDPTGTFFVYAGQYQPEATSTLRELNPPAYVAVVGKPRTFETDDGTVNVSVRPESIQVVDAATRDRWVVETADRTIDRVGAFTSRSTGTSNRRCRRSKASRREPATNSVSAARVPGWTSSPSHSRRYDRPDNGRPDCHRVAASRRGSGRRSCSPPELSFETY
jgi:hypothetical protein